MGVAPQVQWRAIKDRRSLRTDHVVTAGRQATYRKHPNQTLKIVCTSCVTLSLLLSCSTEVKQGGGGCFLTTYPHAFLRWNIRDLVSFQVKSWVGDGSLLCQNNVEWERLWGKKGTTTRPSKGRSPSKGGQVVYVVEYRGSPAEGVPCGKLAGEWQQVPFPIRPAERSTKGKESRVCQQKTGKPQDKVRAYVSVWCPGKNGSILAAQWWFIRSAHYTLHLCTAV